MPFSLSLSKIIFQNFESAANYRASMTVQNVDKVSFVSAVMLVIIARFSYADCHAV